MELDQGTSYPATPAEGEEDASSSGMPQRPWASMEARGAQEVVHGKGVAVDVLERAQTML